MKIILLNYQNYEAQTGC